VEQLIRTRRSRRTSGLTLIEVMIALTILGVGLLSLAAMQLEALRGGRSGHVDTYATTIAQDKLEELRRISWSAAAMNATGNWSTPVTVTSPHQGQVYTVDWRVTNVVTNWTRAIDVRVQWSTPSRPNRSRIISTFRFNREAV
jgi:prepilin-type N-terminal cleavage/methylation domain-containing protein